MLFRMPSSIRSILGHIPNALVLMALLGLLAWGHKHHWKAPQFSAVAPHAAEQAAKTPPPGSSALPPSPTKETDAASQSPSLSTVTLASAGAAAKAGIELARVDSRPMTQEVLALGRVTYDQTHVAQLSSRVSGTVWSVQKSVGQAIREGEILAIVEAVEVGRAKAEFLQAEVDAELKAKTLERMRDVASAISERQIREVEAEAREARIRLFNAQQTLINLGLPIRLQDVAGLHDDELASRVHFLGLPESLTRSLDPETTTANLIPLVAPFDGVITGREIVTGELVSPTSGAQIVIADVSRMWIELDVRKGDAAKLRRGQEVVFTIDGAPGDVQSELAWISTEVDSRTRTVQARIEVDNPLVFGGESGPAGQRLLRANMFGVARIQIRANPKALVVPNAAVQRDGAASVVFVKISENSFQPRIVELGMTDKDHTEVLAGVALGETVAAAGSHVLKAEILKTRLATGGN